MSYEVGCSDGCGTRVVTLSSEDARKEIARLRADGSRNCRKHLNVGENDAH